MFFLHISKSCLGVNYFEFFWPAWLSGFSPDCQAFEEGITFHYVWTI